MSQNPPEPAPVFRARSAALFGAALLLGLGALAIFARIDRERVHELEHFEENTAVGDTAFYSVPNPPPEPPQPVARIDGAALVPISYSKFDWRDTKMQPVARDPASGLTIYKSRKPLPKMDDASEGEAIYFVKINPNEYLRLRRVAAGD